MKVSINWIKEYIDIPSNLTAKQLAHDLTMATVEVEDAVNLGERLEKVVVGKINGLNKHPNADRLTLATVDLGTYGVKEIVCGGSNLKTGMFVAVAMPGAKVFWHGESTLTTLTEAKVRGVASFGMICASEEIGLTNLFPQGGEKEILDISDLAKEPGQNLSDLIGYNDIIFEIDNKSLTNRPDLWGHYGIAREFAAFYNLKLKPTSFPEVSLNKTFDKLTVAIDDKTLCPRYIAVTAEGVENKPSPFWLRSKLSKVGNNTHGYLVDLTNYVMLTLGEPTHVFDREKIKGDKILIRKAKDKEKLKLLDGKELSLNSNNLVIANSEEPMALAGVMGGLDSSVTEATKKVAFEAANFNAVNIRKTSATYGVRTDSSSRFEKSLDPELPKLAAQMFVKLLKEEFPKCEITSVNDSYPGPIKLPEINLQHSFVTSRLGPVDSKNVIDKLSLLGFAVKALGNAYAVKVPSWRATGDVKIPEDLVEEIARITGYDNITAMPISISLSQPIFHKDYELEKSFKLFLAERCGYNEIYSYPWVSEKSLAVVGSDVDSICTLAAPPDQTTAAIRTTLLPGIAEAAERNLRFFEEFKLFELGKVFSKAAESVFSAKGEKLPGQKKLLAGISVGKDAQSIFLTLKGNLSDLLSYHKFDAVFTPAKDVRFNECLLILVGGKEIGKMGLLNKKVKKGLNLSQTEFAPFEIDFETIKTLPQSKTVFKEIPKFPGVDYDLSLLFDKPVSWQSIRDLISSTDNLIESVSFIEEFYGKQIPEGKKAVVLRMVIRSPEKTLTGDEIDGVVKKVLKGLESKLGGELRKA